MTLPGRPVPRKNPGFVVSAATRIGDDAWVGFASSRFDRGSTMRPTARPRPLPPLILLALTVHLLPAGSSGAVGAELRPARGEGPPSGRELFARRWTPDDPRAHGGDGLGPVFNARSCFDCHNQGGPGGAAGAGRNIEIVSAVSDRQQSAPGPSYAFSFSYGGTGFQYRLASNPSAPTPEAPDLAALALIHPGFRESRSLVLHQVGTEPGYAAWRERVPGRHEGAVIRVSQRNPTPLFGSGLIDAIPDEALRSAARRRFAGWPQVRGRLARSADGRVGRFGWKGQAATLGEFVLSAAATEIGLEVPGHHQAADPRSPVAEPPGLDMTARECDALIAYVRDLPAPVARDPGGPREALHVKDGRSLFRSTGCATCHQPKLGPVEGIYSDLLLHDMSPRLADTGAYGVLLARGVGDPPEPGGGAAVPAGTGKATEAEWRTPPLWGLRDSAPYLHDGRAATIDQAITLHGGEAAAAAARYGQLSPRDRQLLEAFLRSLAAPPPDDPGR